MGVLFLLYWLIAIMVQFCSSNEVEVVTVDVEATKGLIISSNHRFLDVRTEEEFNKGHVGVENAVNIPYMFNSPQGRVKNPKFLEQVSSVFSKDENLVVGCQSGVRSASAASDLLKAEFKHVYNMGGGYLAWVAKGLAVNIPQTQNAETKAKAEEAQADQPKPAAEAKTCTKAFTKSDL